MVGEVNRDSLTTMIQGHMMTSGMADRVQSSKVLDTRKECCHEHCTVDVVPSDDANWVSILIYA